MFPPDDSCHATHLRVTRRPCPHGVTWWCGRVPFVVHVLRVDLEATYCGVTEAEATRKGEYVVPPGVGGVWCGRCHSEVSRELACGTPPTPGRIAMARDLWQSGARR